MTLSPPTAAFNLGKLARVHAMAHNILGELHESPLDDPSRVRLEHLTVQTLIVLGSAVPDDMLQELGRLVRPARDDHSSDGELRVVWAQILGWTGGLAWPPTELYALTTAAPAIEAQQSQPVPSPYL